MNELPANISIELRIKIVFITSNIKNIPFMIFLKLADLEIEGGQLEEAIIWIMLH